MQLSGIGAHAPGALRSSHKLDINPDTSARSKNNKIQDNPKVSGPYRVETPGTRAMRALQAYSRHSDSAEQFAAQAHKMADMFGVNLYV